MSRTFARGLQTTSRALVQFTGTVSPNDILASNGPAGGAWEAATKKVCDAIEKADPRISMANIQYGVASTAPISVKFTKLLTWFSRGARAHLSSKDRSDRQLVITVGLATNSGTRVGSVHVHVDGTFKFFPSRAGREGGYEDNILRANIEGHIQNLGNEPSDEAIERSPARGNE
ncbi:hypothetical protein T310_10214 [Rasamsonia emersonii CBS 393.64]|uniref:Uncharacterized protein n=1 Tax=Rasamsonia emersonii (strain ATCC 16479 / CBS 393.64 / IMI 116815) TaxID=1408163 RepID=A0A0F4YDM5_RASE3|nr:hypothetical protein T310_10214 [Rasamsonia emersonii CBS 393.64]KKA16205.1 hypothetical protein T310_10214 [Rasamsonia emersonii CBS 393.64]